MAHRDTDFQHPGECRRGGVWLIVDEQDRVLVVQPSYRVGRYQLVGGCARPDEAPHLAAVREAWEEIGLTLVPDTLLLADWVRANPQSGSAEGINFVFYHRLQPDDTIALNTGGTQAGEEPELLDYKWLADHELDAHCAPYQARRIREAKAALADPSQRGYRSEGHRVAEAA